MFDNRYEVILADTAEARQIHYNLRYQVYCLEEEFESREAFPDQMERDTWDDNSVHFIVRCKETMEWLAEYDTFSSQLIFLKQVVPIEKKKQNDIF